jgi:hypothetical protein
MNPSDLYLELESLATQFILHLSVAPEGISEGVVKTYGPAPYRRLDCDGRALAYMRLRLKRKMLRVDVSGLWLPPKPSQLRIRASNGSASLAISSRPDMLDAVVQLRDSVARTRAVEARAEADRLRVRQQLLRAPTARAAAAVLDRGPTAPRSADDTNPAQLSFAYRLPRSR